MAAGSFLFENKVRPGAYIQLKGLASASNLMSERGTVALIANFPSGGLVTEISASEILSGDCKEKGFPVEMFLDENSPLFYAYPYASKLIICRSNFTTSAAAGATITDKAEGNTAVTVTAKQRGESGNKLSIIIETSEDPAAPNVVKTTFDGAVVDTQAVNDLKDLKENQYVTFSGSGATPEAATYDLSGGNSGSTSSEDITSILAKLKELHWNTLGFCLCAGTTEEDFAKDTNVGLVTTFAKSIREDCGKYRQVVVYVKADEAASFSDYEGVIVVEQNFRAKSAGGSMTALNPGLSVAFVAALTAGTNVGVSNTYHELPANVLEVNPVYSEDKEVETEIKKGRLIFTSRSDGALVIEQDINSLHTLTPDRTYPFTKNRCIRALDEISNTKVLVWEKIYCGKVNNDEVGRNLFKSEVIRILRDIQRIGGIQNFENDNVIVEAGKNVNEIRSYERIQPTDSMEILYSYVTVVG